MKKLREIERLLANLFASGVLRLREKLGPILWQFPPNFGWNKDRFSEFLDLLPRETAAAAKLALRHNDKLKAGAWAKTDASRSLRHAVEIRHPTFMVPEFFALRRDIYVYFDNDAKVHAPFNAKSLAGQFGIAPLSFPTRK